MLRLYHFGRDETERSGEWALFSEWDELTVSKNWKVGYIPR